MTFSRSIGLVIAVVSLPAAASAEPLDVKTGLWESTLTLETSGAPPIDLSKLPPERRARIEAALKKQEAQGPRKHTIVDKQCVTQEQLSERPFDTAARNLEKEGESCKTTVLSSTRKRWSGKLTCTGKAAVTSEWIIDAVSREEVKGVITSHASNDARSMSSKATMSGRWLSAACPKK
jgi:Protein of unknown function (DUF3617)